MVSNLDITDPQQTLKDHLRDHSILVTIPSDAIEKLSDEKRKQMQQEIQDVVDKYTKGK